jgi:hypothetical protein
LPQSPTENSIAASPGQEPDVPVPSHRAAQILFPQSMKNIHLYCSAALHLVCFFLKKKKSVVCILFPLKFQEKKMKGHFFLFKHWCVASNFWIKMCHSKKCAQQILTPG